MFDYVSNKLALEALEQLGTQILSNNDSFLDNWIELTYALLCFVGHE